MVRWPVNFYSPGLNFEALFYEKKKKCNKDGHSCWFLFMYLDFTFTDTWEIKKRKSKLRLLESLKLHCLFFPLN